MMRFKTGLCLKSSLVLALVLFSVILLKKKDVKDVSDIHSVGREDNTRNFTKNSNREIAADEAKAGQGPGEPMELQLSDSDADDSLAGRRIDGLPNITDFRYFCRILKLG